MKVVFISPVTPYKENMGGPSGHPYHLMVERPSNIEIVVYTFNQNNLSNKVIKEVENELNIKIKIIKQPQWYKFILKFHLSFIRLLLRFPINYYIRLPKSIITDIYRDNPDIIWGYGQEFSGILSQFKSFKRIHTAPDSYCLHWYRRLERPFTLSHYREYMRVVINYIKYYRMESLYDTSENIKYHFVGDTDARFVKQINPAINASFFRHPHYETISSDRNIRFHQDKVKLLIAGRYDLYSYEASNQLFSRLSSLDSVDKKFFNENYEFTILGKGWNVKVDELRKSGIKVKLIEFVPNYIEEIIKYDIQINPLSVGTGTKGKVLDAIANGLLVIGTPYALENIAVKNQESCIEYSDANEIIEILKDIPMRKDFYENIALNGRNSVLKFHNRKLIAEQLFGFMKE